MATSFPYLLAPFVFMVLIYVFEILLVYMEYCAHFILYCIYFVTKTSTLTKTVSLHARKQQTKKTPKLPSVLVPMIFWEFASLFSSDEYYI